MLFFLAFPCTVEIACNVIWNYTSSTIAQSLSAELVVVMPIYNEAANIENVVNEWVSVLKQVTGKSFVILALNDGSRDATAEKLAELEAIYGIHLCVVNKINSGHGPTCRLGYDIAAGSNAQWVLQIDSDGQCNPDYFAEFWNMRLNADCIFGQRIMRDDGRARVITSWICTTVSALVCGVQMVDANVPFRLLRTDTLREVLGVIPANFNIHNVALTVILKRLGSRIRWAYVPIHFRNRQGGSNSINLFKVAKMGAEMIFSLFALKKPGT